MNTDLGEVTLRVYITAGDLVIAENIRRFDKPSSKVLPLKVVIVFHVSLLQTSLIFIQWTAA